MALDGTVLALGRLRHGRVTQHSLEALAVAREALAHAEEVVRTTHWPTDVDYDAA